MIFLLSPNDRAALELLLRGSVAHAREGRRAQALLRLADGEAVVDIADELGVDRRTIYRWAERFASRRDDELLSRLCDAPRRGRPREAMGIIDPLINDIVDDDPSIFGYKYSNWTADLLRDYLIRYHGIEVSRRSIGLAIHRLHIRWKRPRYQLARRSPVWGQSKGG